MNREIKRTERDGSVTRQFYDPDGQLVKVIRPNEYAGAGEDGKGVQYTYDAQGRVLTIITPEELLRSVISQEMHYNYAYDALGRRTEKRAGDRTLLAFQYDLNGNCILEIERDRN